MSVAPGRWFTSRTPRTASAIRSDNNDGHSNSEFNPHVIQFVYFSGDDDRDVRVGDVSRGLPTSDYRHQADRDQAAGDRMVVNGMTTLSPGAVMAGAGPSGIGLPVPGIRPVGVMNAVHANQHRYNAIPSMDTQGVNTFVPPAGATVQDDMDALELTGFDLDGDHVHDTPIYFSLDAASPSLGGGFTESDILVSPPGVAGFGLFAARGQIGLGVGDELDALAVWDMDHDLVATPGTDYALFSLAPISPSLWGLDGGPGVAGADDDGLNGVDDLGEVGLADDASPADIWVTDFTGAYTLYLAAATIGMLDTDNVDALDVEPYSQPQIDDTVALMPGDLNCDGLINNGDIDPFVLALTNPYGYEAAYPDCDVNLADINGDGFINNGDIDGFVALLSS